MSDRPNLLVVVLDTARADHLPPHRTDLAPRLAREAERCGTMLDTFRTTAPWTLPSHASLFSGAYPTEHGIHGRAAVRRDARVATVRTAVERQDERWLPEALRRAGYRTWGVSANPWVSEPMGLSYGFDTFVPVGAAKLRPRGAPTGTRPRPSDRIPPAIRRPLGRAGRQWVEWRRGIDAGGRRGVEHARRLMAERTDRPWFGFVNLMEAHVPYAPPRAHNELHGLAGLLAPAVSRKRRSYEQTLSYNLGRDGFTAAELETIGALYRGEIRYLDALAGRLLDAVAANTLVVVTADHGEALGEHHQLDHQVTMIEEVLRIPLIVLGDGPPARELDTIRDLTGWLASAAGLDPGPWDERRRVPAGVAVAEYESTTAHDRRSVGVARTGGFAPAQVALLEAEMAAVVERDRKLLRVAGADTLLNAGTDEPVDDVRATLERLAAYLAAARSVVAPEPPSEGYSAQEESEIESRLEQLGYL
jgi:arylsulfatase A-like enzyme